MSPDLTVQRVPRTFLVNVASTVSFCNTSYFDAMRPDDARDEALATNRASRPPWPWTRRASNGAPLALPDFLSNTETTHLNGGASSANGVAQKRAGSVSSAVLALTGRSSPSTDASDSGALQRGQVVEEGGLGGLDGSAVTLFC